jgi:rare lipoprotein A
MIVTGTALVIAETSAGPVSSPGAASAPQTTAAPVTQQAAGQPLVSGSAASAAKALIIGGIPVPGTGKFYRLQVGAYRVPRNAVDSFEKLKNANLSPAYENVDGIYRVVLPGLRSEEIESVAEILYSIGFAEAIIREEY